MLPTPRSWPDPEAARPHRPSIATAALLLALAIAAAAAISFRPIYEPDLWWHLAQGRETAAGHLVRTNVFNFLYGTYPQSYTSWLFDLSEYLAWRGAGAAGIQIAQTAWLTLTLVLIFAGCRRRAAARPAVLAVLLLGLAVIEPRALPRPHLASFAGLAASARIIERARARRTAAPLTWAMPTIALWSNLHVEAFLGALLVGIFAAAEIISPAALPRRDGWRAAAIAAACLLATLANPYGWGIAAYFLENWRVPQLLNIAELRPAYLPNYRPFFVYLGVAAAALLWRPRREALADIAAAVVFGALGVRFLRFTPLIVVVTAPAVAARLTELMRRGLDGRALVATALAATLATARQPLIVFTRLGVGTHAVAPPEFFPAGLGRTLSGLELEGPVFNSMNLGGYLAWEMYPQARTFQDSRLQAVPPDHFLRILAASRDPAAWEQLVAGVEWAVISLPRTNELSGAGHFPDSRWAPVFEDQAVRVVVRRGGRFDRPVPR